MSRLSNLFHGQTSYAKLEGDDGGRSKQKSKAKGTATRKKPAVTSNNPKVPTAQGLCQRARPAELMVDKKSKKSGKSRH